MEADWRPIDELRSGHYAVGRLEGGMEIDIYRAGARILNVATGEDADGVTAWRRGRQNLPRTDSGEVLADKKLGAAAREDRRS